MKRIVMVALLLLLSLLIGLAHTPRVEAGMFNADSEVTYKEYWMPHSQFTAHCVGGLPEIPGGTWYVEPGRLDQCPKPMQINLPDNFASAIKAEIYMDLWRNHDSHSARFRVNGNPTVYASPVGYEWSRTPWITEIPLSSLVQGMNTITYWGEGGLYHIHDISVRLYYDETHPLIGNDVTPADGELLTIKDDTVEVPAYSGGALVVNDDKLTLQAQVEAGAAFVEFHAYYDGYDVDNDGENRDWQSSNRNNRWPGGKETISDFLNGTANHIGTVKAPPAGGVVTQVWNIDHIINQPGVRFKIRILDAAGNAREGAGGVTPEYKLVRDYPTVYYTIPDFEDVGIHMSGGQPDAATYNFVLPADLDLSTVSEAYFLGMYWKKPRFSFNGMNKVSVQNGQNDEWTLGIRPLTKTVLQPGNNSLVYSYSGSGVGHFVEEPGPMLVLKGNYTTTLDEGKPVVAARNPAPGATNVDIFTSVAVRIVDQASGVNVNSVIMSVNGNPVQPVFSGTANNLTATYVPTQPLPPNTLIPITLYACDLRGNCMLSADTYSFTTEPPDLTPPVISNVNIVSTDVDATITWTTNEPADSKVEYGLTTGYEKPAVSAAPLVIQHSLQLTGLQSQSTYHFRLSSRDFNNNLGTTADLTFQTKAAPAAIHSDDFSACVINSAVWSYINPLGDAPLVWTGTGAQISIPAGEGHDIWRSTLASPRLIQYVANGDFDVEVKFEKQLTKKTQSIGVLAQQDAVNYLRFNFQNDGNATSLVLVNTANGNSQVVFSTPVASSATNYMRINRAGDVWNLQYSSDGVNWNFATSYTRTLVLSQIGPFVGNTGTDPAHINVIDYFINLNDPLDVEDPPITLNVTKVGQGAVTRDPDKASYGCNETVNLTAAPAPDWTFTGWSGALTGLELVKTIVLTKSENVTATFSNSTPYALNVEVVSNGPGVGGTVTKDPNLATYPYGTEVELTATPTLGWSFLGWSGDWTATDPVTIVPVTGNMDVVATFEQDQYTLDTLILAEGVGTGGTITVDPVKPTYLYGDEVTITVTPETGWTFAGWADGSTGVSGNELVTTLTMTQDVIAIARLVQNQYALDINLVHNGEPGAIGGSVTATPDQESYGHGQVVSVTAAVAQGWLFTGWAGDLAGNDLEQSLTMNADKVITATFTQQQYTVTVTVDGPGGVANPGHVVITPDKPYFLFNDIVTLTPVAEAGYEFVMWSGDLTGTDEPALLAVEKNYNITAHFAVDTTPIEIINPSIEVMPGGTLATVTWETDVPGTSVVDYGETVLYEIGTESKDTLETQHTILLSGLTADTFYHLQITSVDQHGNSVSTEDMTFTTSNSSGIFSDDFSACEIDDRWTWVNPLNDSQRTTTGRHLEITVPGGDTDHTLYTDGITVPRIMQPSNDDDFTVEVKFDSVLADIGATQGIVIEQDGDTFLRFEFFNRLNKIRVYVVGIRDGAIISSTSGSRELESTPTSLYMRVVRAGDKWQQFFSLDGVEWTLNKEFTFDLAVKRVGVYAGNSKIGNNPIPTHTVLVDYFFNTAAPITPEDSHYAVNVDIEGSGNVTRNPNRGYYCGQEVTLTATPSDGWIFLGWSGDASGTDPVRTLTVTGDMNVTAQFSNDGFKLVVPLILR